MKESKIEKKLKTGVEGIGGMCIKMSPMFFAGVPDRLCLLPHGLAVFVELKATKQKPRKLQKIIHQKLRGLGFGVAVLDSVEKVEAFVNCWSP